MPTDFLDLFEAHNQEPEPVPQPDPPVIPDHPYVLVCGGREYADYAHLCEVLDEINPSRVIHGGARGADTLAGDWAAANEVPCKQEPADWDLHPHTAGHVRNQTMIETCPDLVLAFSGGSGTDDMIRRARRAGVPVIQPSSIPRGTRTPC